MKTFFYYNVPRRGLCLLNQLLSRKSIYHINLFKQLKINQNHRFMQHTQKNNTLITQQNNRNRTFKYNLSVFIRKPHEYSTTANQSQVQPYIKPHSQIRRSDINSNKRHNFRGEGLQPKTKNKTGQHPQQYIINRTSNLHKHIGSGGARDESGDKCPIRKSETIRRSKSGGEGAAPPGGPLRHNGVVHHAGREVGRSASNLPREIWPSIDIAKLRNDRFRL